MRPHNRQAKYVVPVFLEALKKEKDSLVIWYEISAITYLGGKEVLPQLEKLAAESKTKVVQEYAQEAVYQINNGIYPTTIDSKTQ